MSGTTEVPLGGKAFQPGISLVTISLGSPGSPPTDTRGDKKAGGLLVIEGPKDTARAQGHMVCADAPTAVLRSPPAEGYRAPPSQDS